MLLAIRERVMGVVGWILLGILFIAFAFFGLNSYMQSSAENYAAVVNDVEITPRQQQRAYQNLRSRMQELMGDAYNPAMLDETALKTAALQQLINEELLLQAADTEGFAASDQLVAMKINAIDAFKQDGVFSKEKYSRVLNLQGLSPAGFEWQLQREIIAEQLQSGIQQTAAATRDDLQQAYMLQGQQRNFSYLTIPVAGFYEQVEVTDDDIKQYYDAHTDEFMTPERVRVQYLQLDANSIAVDNPVDEQALEALYNERSEIYVKPEERRARHILIQLSQDADATSDGAALQKAEDAIKRIKGGEAFEAVAREVSDDPGSAANGGDLGFFSRGLMTPAFEEVAFSLTPGELSEPVKSSFGYHIIEVLEIKPETATPLEEVRAELVEVLRNEDRSNIFFERSEILTSLTFEQPDTLQGAADTLGLEIKESDWISRDGGVGIAANEDIVEAAFSEDVLLNGNNSTPVETSGETVVVLRLLEHQDAAHQPLDEISDIVKQRLIDEKARLLAESKGAELLASITEKGETLEDTATALQATVQQTGMVGRNAAEHPAPVVAKAFMLDTPVEEQPVYAGFALPEGDYVILALNEVKQGDLTSLPEGVRKQAWREFSSIQGAAEMAAVQETLKKQAKIVIPPPAEE
jgi:peptidyl-prolyl cis-trans isomerase D